MNIGVTGTRFGANPTQLSLIYSFLSEANLQEYGELHHGDCIGVDIEVASMARQLGYRIVCHPPLLNEHRGNFGGDEMREELSHFARNRNIVNSTSLLLVVPQQNEWQKYGGTWYTNDYALKVGKPRIIFFPNGTIEK